VAVLRFIVRLFALVGLLVVLLAVAVGAWLWDIAGRRQPLPDAIVLELDLSRPLVDRSPADPLAAAVFGRDPSVTEVVEALDRARADPRVKGVLARVGGAELGMAKIQEIRDAVARLRETGRFAVAFADSFGEGASGMRDYYLAAAFGEIWMQPTGTVGITGVSTSVPFLRGAFDKLGIEPQLEHRRDYKSFSNTFTEQDFTPQHREMTEWLVRDLFEQMVEGIAAGRGLSVDEVRPLVDRAPLTDREATDGRLLDRLLYRDEAQSAVRDMAGGGTLVETGDYLHGAGRPNREGPVVAVVHGNGPIRRGGDELGSLLGDEVMAADTISEAILEAVGDRAVQAIVFRVDSGGGSAVASETIRRAVVQARNARKPIVVSMGDAAASGGYWVAVDADRVIAQPGTLTGSIGVVSGKFATRGFWDTLGVNWGEVAQGRNAGMFSGVRPFSEAERARLDALLDETYRNFLQRVAQARRMPIDAVEAAAGGRVFTGRQARERGLVDETGGLYAAIAAAKRLAGIPDEAPVTVWDYPRPKGPFGTALEFFGMGEAVQAIRLVRELRPVLRVLAPIMVRREEETVRMPDLGLR